MAAGVPWCLRAGARRWRGGGRPTVIVGRHRRELLTTHRRGVEDARARTIMTVYCYLDDVKDEDGGALYFARARPGAVRVRVRKGLAAIFYSALEDGTLGQDGGARRRAAGRAPSAWVLALRVYDRPRPLARRVILPAVLWLPFGGAPPKALAVASYRFFARCWG